MQYFLSVGREKFQAVLRTVPNNTEAHMELGALYVKQQQYSEAIREYQAVLQFHPTNADALYELALIYVRQEQYDQAVDVCRRAIIFNPEDPDMRKTLARIYLALAKQELEIAAHASSDAGIQEILKNLEDMKF